MIGMAIKREPELLVYNETTTALDVNVQKNILELIKTLQIENNMGVIFITHNFSVVVEIAQQVIVLYKRNIVEENTTSALFNNPQHLYTKALLACRPALHPKD